MMRPGRLPAWVRLLDAGALAALLLFLFVFLLGGFTAFVGPFRLRVHAPFRLLFIAAALAAIRHAAHAADPLHRRVARGLRAPEDGSAAAVVPAALATRIAVLLVGLFAVITIGIPKEFEGFHTLGGTIENLPARFDAGWYSSIALNGYSFSGRFDRQENVAFFPAYPMLTRAIGHPFGAFEPGVSNERRGARILWAGVTLSLIAFGWGCLYLWRLARDTIGADRAGSAVALLAAYPFAVYFSAPYTESLFLLGCVAAIYHFRREEYIGAAVWGALVGLTRPNGCFLSVVLALIAAERWWKTKDLRIVRPLLSASTPGLAMLGFSVYVHSLTGSYFGWARMQEAWGRSFSGLAPIERAYAWLSDQGLLHVVEGVPYDTLNSLGVIFALVMLWPVARRLGPAFAVFILINMVPPLLAGGVLSLGRMSSTLFPVFLALASMVRPRAVPSLVTAFAVGQGLVAVLFFTWRPLF